jgi:peptide/nickel transport system substrate-binding protein
MKRFRSAFPAAVSFLLWIAIAAAERPRYGGTLRVETSAAMRTLNPAVAAVDPADAAARRLLFPLIFETLVTVDPALGLRPALATAWQSEAEATRWRFHLRAAVKLHDGTPLDGGRIAAALSSVEPEWRVTADTGSVTIESARPMPDLLWVLAERRHAIAFSRPGGGEPLGSGPFAIERWEPRRLRLRAHEDHWGGRPFVNSVQVEMARPVSDQLTSLELGRADVVSLRAEDVRRASQRDFRIASSAPREIIALVFGQNRSPAESVRQALSIGIDREAMWSALLQRQGEPAAALLPQWLSGYARVLDTRVDRQRARSIVAGLPAVQRVATLHTRDTDSLLRSIADRIVIDARDVGLTIKLATANAQVTSGGEMRLVRAEIDPATPERALSTLLTTLGMPSPGLIPGASLETVRQVEQTVLDQHAVIPLLHLPDVYAAARHVNSWNEPFVLTSGAWNFADVWLKPTP